jgi:benzil reductase ((S)-benzoin forming)
MKKLAIITGASKGIGRGLAERILKEKSTQVWGISRTKGWDHERYRHFDWDLGKSSADEIELRSKELIQNALKQDFVSIWLINNAGTLGNIAHLTNQSAQSISEVLHLNVLIPTLLMKVFLDGLSSYNGNKVVLNISSGAGKYPVDGWSAYCASKAALDMFSLVADEEEKLKKHGFHIFAISPGVVDTDMQDAIRQADEKSFSNLNKFLSYKDDGLLSSLGKVGNQLWQVLDRPESYNDVILDVRKF